MMSEEEVQEMMIRERYGSEKAYRKLKVNSRNFITEDALDEIKVQFQIPSEYNHRVPVLNKRMY